MFDQSGIPALTNLEFLLGFPEHEVPLPPTMGRPSQNDVFVLAKGSDGLATIAVEGKVSEAFDKPVDKRFTNPSPGEKERLDFLLNLLELDREAVGPIGYQLLHRTASAILEAQRFGARHAVMLVHSFSQELKHFGDYKNFVGLYGRKAEPNTLYSVKEFCGISLSLGWSVGNAEYLSR